MKLYVNFDLSIGNGFSFKNQTRLKNANVTIIFVFIEKVKRIQEKTKKENPEFVFSCFRFDRA